MKGLVAGAAILTLSASSVTLDAAPAEAHAIRLSVRATGFTPNERVLQCIRGPWNGMSMESRGNYQANSGTYKGAYQMDNAFWRAYGIDKNVEVARDWYLDPLDDQWKAATILHAGMFAGRHHLAPPDMQDEVARNGARARGLQPWPKPNRVCPRS